MSVLTKIFEEKTVRQMSSAVDVEVMESELSEAESIFGQLSMAYKLYGGCAAQASVCEERQRLRAEEVVDSRGHIKLLSDEDNLELIQQEQVQNSTVEQTIAVPVPLLGPRSFTTRMKAMTSRKRVTRMIKKPCDQCQTGRSGRDKERRKSRRKLKSKLKNEFSIISTAMEVKGQEMMLKHANLSREAEKYRDREHLSSTM